MEGVGRDEMGSELFVRVVVVEGKRGRRAVVRADSS
jgi:hypothetical protein